MTIKISIEDLRNSRAEELKKSYQTIEVIQDYKSDIVKIFESKHGRPITRTEVSDIINYIENI